MEQITLKLLDSWSRKEGNVNSTAELLGWIQELNTSTYVKIEETSIADDPFWFYDDYRGEILNRKRSFFSVLGMRYFLNERFVLEQPIILQKEIGYLGIIVKEIDGVLNFLMQAKIEPGNINHIQISPTIQATKSNFTRVHGGRLPYYFEYFEQARKNGIVIYDQIQSEQGSRFDGKRNRNIILFLEKEIEIHPNYRWMTLGQIKELMKIDNLVNMDTRTVLSGIPFICGLYLEDDKKRAAELFYDKALYNSIFKIRPTDSLASVMASFNDYKMFHDVMRTAVPLNQLVDWDVDEYGVVCRKRAEFMVRYYDIEISGREVRRWRQPLFKAEHKALYVLFTNVSHGIRRFLISLQPEIGNFDKVELGPSLQISDPKKYDTHDLLYAIFLKYDEKKTGILNDVVLSEEGGRFYHEQNRNVIIEIDQDDIKKIPSGNEYLWVDYSCLNFLVQFNNCLNIQLRNLLALLNI